ncbi:hypothetical protein DENIS_5183 [Desulfonema ishimotonii]|uniref:Uncharacterized protein n=1 Tax=Desulfonema ishimotonii TaxID=45657 RepID=A0A401G4S4_9BACT|nr:hypothetical protein DENIS_5183 [Desulfonema ishimotonii]
METISVFEAKNNLSRLLSNNAPRQMNPAALAGSIPAGLRKQ